MDLIRIALFALVGLLLWQAALGLSVSRLKERAGVTEHRLAWAEFTIRKLKDPEASVKLPPPEGPYRSAFALDAAPIDRSREDRYRQALETIIRMNVDTRDVAVAKVALERDDA